MKILFFGDSITDAVRSRNCEGHPVAPESLGAGYVNAIASDLIYYNPIKYQIINTGIGGNRIVDLYARIKSDCWNYKPDVLSILVGVNDLWHEISNKNGVDINRFEKVYRMIIEDTIKELPNIQIILLEPYVQEGCATKEDISELFKIKEYAETVKRLAIEYNLTFVALQQPLDEYANRFGNDKTLIDGVHPGVAGCRVIANEWLKNFKRNVDR